MAVWPASVPFRPLAGSLVITRERNAHVFKPGAGGDYARPQYPGFSDIYRGTLQLTGPECDLLMAFWEEDCASGTLSFDMYDWARLTHGSLTLVEKNWDPDQPPEIRHRLGLQYQVALTLSKTV